MPILSDRRLLSFFLGLLLFILLIAGARFTQNASANNTSANEEVVINTLKPPTGTLKVDPCTSCSCILNNSMYLAGLAGCTVGYCVNNFTLTEAAMHLVAGEAAEVQEKVPPPCEVWSSAPIYDWIIDEAGMVYYGQFTDGITERSCASPITGPVTLNPINATGTLLCPSRKQEYIDNLN